MKRIPAYKQRRLDRERRDFLADVAQAVDSELLDIAQDRAALLQALLDASTAYKVSGDTLAWPELH